MLSSLRKFSTSIYAKIFLGIIAIPFIFWGMGSSFTGGSKNVVVMINKEKFTTQDFANFIQRYSTPDKKFNEGEIEEFLSIFIGDKLIDKEIERLNFKLSDKSLGKLIKNQKDFQRDGEFSRVEYEKFLLKNNIPVSLFEANLAKQERKRQLLNFVGGGLLPSEFIVNISYNKINQIREVQIINLENLFKKENNFSDTEIRNYYEKNKESFIETYKSANIIELTPSKLTGEDKFNEIFYKKIDEIDDLIIQGKNLENLTNKFNLKKTNVIVFNKNGNNLNSEKNTLFPVQLFEKIFSLSNVETIALLELNDKYFLVEVVKTEKISGNIIDDNNLRNVIIANLEKKKITEKISEIIAKINDKKFLKTDFDKLSKDINTPIKLVRLKNKNDESVLDKEIINQIYNFSEKKIILTSSKNFTNNFLVYIDKINNVNISDQSDLYNEYLNLSKTQLRSKLLNTYDSYIKKKYKIDVNYKALETVKNYFN